VCCRGPFDPPQHVRVRSMPCRALQRRDAQGDVRKVRQARGHLRRQAHQGQGRDPGAWSEEGSTANREPPGEGACSTATRGPLHASPPSGAASVLRVSRAAQQPLAPLAPRGSPAPQLRTGGTGFAGRDGERVQTQKVRALWSSWTECPLNARLETGVGLSFFVYIFHSLRCGRAGAEHGAEAVSSRAGRLMQSMRVFHSFPLIPICILN
jgi:hypothetical protein